MRQISFQFYYYYIQNYLAVYKGIQKFSPIKSRSVLKLYIYIHRYSSLRAPVPSSRLRRTIAGVDRDVGRLLPLLQNPLQTRLLLYRKRLLHVGFDAFRKR